MVLALNEPIMMVEVLGSLETPYYYHFDALGSVAAITDSSGALVESYDYTAFGKASIYNSAGNPISSSAIDNPYMFTGRRFDTETGLYYYRARIYDPYIGRFMQTDPIGYADSMNLYQYCGNNPVNWIDPMGRCKGANADWGDMDFYERFGNGYYYGTAQGEMAQKYWADKYVNSGSLIEKIGNGAGLAFSSLWQPDTFKETLSTIALAGTVAEPASRTKPWLGKAEIHAAHNGMGRHFEIIIRVGKSKNLKVIVPGKGKLIYFGIH